MKTKTVTGIMLTLLLTSMLTLAFNIEPVKSDWTWTETIYIRADGSIDPDTAPISSFDNVTYTLTDNIIGYVPFGSSAIVVERSNIVVDGNGYTLQGTGSGIGIDLSGRSNVTIQNTKIKKFEYGIHLAYSSNNIIQGNNITDNCWGICLYSSSNNNTISRNSIRNNYFGIELGASNYNSISGNNLKENIGSGIYLTDSSSHNIISENDPLDNCITLFWSSNFNSICRNNITYCYSWGIWLYYSSHNSISGNNIANCSCGVFLHASSNNSIYHNNFINNIRWHFYSETPGFVNFCDDGYPSGGNYWSDYEERYPDAEELDDSGIWNTPYVIEEDNQDNYPLMYPWGAPPPLSYTLTVYSSPTGVTFTVDGAPRTTLWSGTYSEGASVSLVMPETHGGYIWSHWLEDRDTNRTKTVTMDTNTTLTGVFTPVPPIATVDIDPDTLNLKSKGKWITCYIELPKGYDVSDIERTTILLNDTIPVASFWVDKPLESVVGDYDDDGIPDLMFKFSRTEVSEYIHYVKGITYGDVTLTITGELYDGSLFEGSDVIRIKMPSEVNSDDDDDEYVDIYDIAIPEFPSLIVLPTFMIATLLAVIVYRRKHSM